ncbi:MAG: HalOD1 output domain-containing protein [Halobacteriota archaeon]
MAEHYDRVLLLITEAVSDMLGRPIEELPPLSESINLEGLDAVMSHTASDVAVIFSYAGLRVFVHSEGFVYVRPMCEDGCPNLGGKFVHST